MSRTNLDTMAGGEVLSESASGAADAFVQRGSGGGDDEEIELDDDVEQDDGVAEMA